MRILENEEGKLHKSQVYEINLATTLDVMITQCNVSSFNGMEDSPGGESFLLVWGLLGCPTVSSC